MYVPTNCKTLAEAKEPQIRLGIQGFPGSGKTWAALTFPNPVVVNIDRGLGAHTGRTDVIEVPLYDIDFCKKINSNHKDKTFLKDTILMWMKKEAPKLEADQTLIFDGLTGLQNSYNRWYDANPVYSAKSGKEDEYATWRLRIELYTDICETFQQLRCHVVFICHEAEKKEKSGEYLGKLRPLLTGQFCDQIGSYFTDWVRQLTSDKPKDLTAPIDEKKLKQWDLSDSEFKAMCNTFPRNTIYYWQLESDDVFDGKVSSLVNFPRFIPANYASFKKYMRQ